MKIFYLSLTAVVVLTAHSAMAQAQQSNSGNNHIKIENSGVYIGENTDYPKNGSLKGESKAVAIGKSSKVGESAVAVGYKADAGKEGATAVGKTAKAQSYAVAMGFQANAGVQAISMGNKSKAQGNFAVALGNEANAKGESSFAIGRNSYANSWANAFGAAAKATGQISTALGWSAQASGERAQAIGPEAKASGKRALSFGSGTNTTAENGVSIGSQTNNYAMGAVSMGHNNIIQASSKNAVVIGNNIHNTANNSVFLGDSSAYVEKGETTGGIGKVNGNYAGVDAKGVVSVGSKGNERRIQNVAAGLLSHRSTDAVNGSQLHATNQRVEEVNKDAKAGIAAAMAFKDVPFVPGKWSYAAGAARYSSESAVSLNLGRTSANGKYAISGGISSDSRGRVGFRVGVSGVFN
ncbi:Haemagluttinin domain protein [Histophilus somni 2336]|uniref:YadA family autotransporter adhesin n=2 Tax=Histophilus somni TaxID=731 RepID=UPI000045D5D9|nr:YadA-like family protein [Histophilus somni]ACA32638.1 Haemagluttinin domain protein [Histophilus somni 2336]